MCSKWPDTSRETATPLTDGCNNNQLVQLSPFNNLCLIIIVQDVIEIKNLSGKGITQASLKLQLQLCPELTQE